MQLFVQAIIDGILIGGIYSLIAIGLNLIFGVMKIINFAQGSFLMLGMYISYWAFTLLGLHPYLSLPISFILLFLLGGMLQKFIFSKMLDAPEHNQLLITFGIMIMIENIALIWWSPDLRGIKIPNLNEAYQLFDMIINKPKLFAFIFTVVITAVFYWFLQKTVLGKAIRATAIDREGAYLVGIKVKRINIIAFGIGAAIAGNAGTLLSPFLYASPTIGNIFILKAFVVVVLGGLGNFFGALIGGLIVGISESIGGVYLPGSLKELLTYVIFVLILLFRPNGLFGGGAK